MAKMVVVLEWDEKELGRNWMNEDNLHLCLFSGQHSKPELLKVDVVAIEENALALEGSGEIEEPL